MTSHLLRALLLARESLSELRPREQDYDFGPAYGMAEERRTKALALVEAELRKAGHTFGRKVK